MKKFLTALFLPAVFFFASAGSYADAMNFSLLGEKNVELICGTPYTETGYIACDSDGKDVSDEVCVYGNLNVMKCGEYTLNYAVEDRYGCKACAQRLVTVCPAALPEKQAEDEKTIYLTYDDGPGQYTEEILDLLDEYKAKATFFVVGSSLQKNPEALKRAADCGHSIGVHCNVHDYEILYSSEEYFLNDLFEIREAVFELTGCRPDIMRFPGSSETAYQYSSHRIEGGFQTLREDILDLGIEYFDWDDSADLKTDSFSDPTGRVLNAAERKENFIVLLHDTRYGCVSTTKKLLEFGSEKGFQFKALTAAAEAVHIR